MKTLFSTGLAAILAVITIFAVLAVLAPAAIAGPESALLVGTTCRGTFDTGTGHEKSRGAVYTRFYEKGGVLALELKTRNSREAFENPLVNFGPSETEEVELVAVSGTEAETILKFVDVRNSFWSLTFRPVDGKLTGEVDPRHDMRRRNWHVAAVSMSCDQPRASAK